MAAVPAAAAKASASSLQLPPIPRLLMTVPVIQLPQTEDVAREINGQIAELEKDLLAQKKDISNRSLGLATDSVVAGFTCDRSIVFHEGVDNIGNVEEEQRQMYEKARAERMSKNEGGDGAQPAAAADGSSVATSDAATNNYRRDDDATMKRKCETLISLRKARAKLLSEKVFTMDKNDDVLERYFESIEEYVAKNSITQQAAEESVELAMRIFIAENYTGELSVAEVEHFRPLLARYSYMDPLEERFTCRLLTTDGEMPAPAIVLPSLLLFSLAMVSVGRRFEAESAATVTDSTAVAAQQAQADAANSRFAVRFENTNIWRLRVLYRHQLCLLHRAHSLFLKIADCVDALLMNAPFNASPRILVEVGYVQNYYHKIDLAAENFFKALKLSGLELQEEAMMGVRTRWQQQQVAQQVLKARSTHDDGLSISAEEQLSFPLPKSIEGEKDGHDLFDYPRESTEQASTIPSVSPLSVTDQAIILALCLNIRNTNPLHGLVNHHVQIYLERLLIDPAPQPFIIRAVLLLLRSRAEKGRSRVAQRSFLQMQELLDQFTTRRDPSQATFYRSDSRYFYLVNYPSVWNLRQEFADCCFEDNLFKTALDLYENIHDFDNVIKCCKQLDKRRRAENLARDLLETDPNNPMLWVAVGEATREDKHLWKAWELSGHKMAAPMRSLARLALDREQYDKVVEYFELATKINPIFGGDWFSLGFASMKLKNLDRGTVAFTRVCQIDPNDAYAWNNLGSLLLQQGKTRPAFNAISQALRNNRRSWRMWQNYFSIATELLEITEATHALAIILEIGAKEVRLDGDLMMKFTQAAIRYLKGEIQSTGNDELPEKRQAPVASLREGVENFENAEIPHFATATTNSTGEPADDDVELAVDLQPFGADVEMPETYFPEKEAKKKAEAADLQKAILQRYRDRVKGVFRQITDLFVNDADLYDCVATLLRFTDGPVEAFKYREKEHRVASQVDQVHRDATKFSRLVAALSHMSGDAIASLSEASAATSDPSADAASAQLQLKEAVYAVKKTMNNVDSAAELASQHLENHEGQRTLQVARQKLNAAIKEANNNAKK